MVATTTSVQVPKAPSPFDGEKGWGTRVTLDQVRNHTRMQTPTDTHVPIPHIKTIDKFTEYLKRDGFILSEPAIYLSNDDYRSNMYTGFGIAHPDLTSSGDTQWQAFLINSHNKKFSLRIGVGEETFVCTNGMIFASLGQNRTKHTKNVWEIDASGLPRWQNRINLKVRDLLKEFTKFKSITDSFKKVELDPNMETAKRAVQSICVEAACRGIVNDSGAVNVYKHWLEPEHPEFKKDGTVDRLRQAFTSHDRGKSYFGRGDRNVKMIDLLSHRFGTLTSSGAAPVRSFDQPAVVTPVVDGGDF